MGTKDSNSFQSIHSETGETKEIELPYCYWYEVEGKGKKTELKIDTSLIIELLINEGFCLYAISENDLNRIIIQIKNGIINESNVGKIRNLLTNDYMDRLPENISVNFTKKDLRTALIRGLNQFVERNKLDSLPIKKIEFLQDTKDISYFPFINGLVIVNKKSYKIKNYSTLSKLNKYIWKSQIINHDIKIIDLLKLPDFNFWKFLRNICSTREPEREFDEKRFESLLCLIGYLLHNYRTSSNKFAVVLTESSIDEEPQGRTGKSLLIKSIGKLRKVTNIDGKNFSFETQFAFQTCELDSQILYFDDVKKNFDFQRLFCAITEGLSYEKKNKDRITLSPEQSPKICISSNFGIRGNSESDKARKFEMELLCYYNSNFRPYDEFKEMFFDDWTKDQWNLFYNFMLSCVMIYYEHGCIPNYNSDTLETKKLLVETSQDFIEFANGIERNNYIPIEDIHNEFLNFTGFDKKIFSKNKLTKWLKKYCECFNLKYKNETHNLGTSVKKCYYLGDA